MFEALGKECRLAEKVVEYILDQRGLFAVELEDIASAVAREEDTDKIGLAAGVESNNLGEMSRIRQAWISSSEVMMELTYLY